MSKTSSDFLFIYLYFYIFYIFLFLGKVRIAFLSPCLYQTHRANEYKVVFHLSCINKVLHTFDICVPYEHSKLPNTERDDCLIWNERLTYDFLCIYQVSFGSEFFNFNFSIVTLSLSTARCETIATRQLSSVLLKASIN